MLQTPPTFGKKLEKSEEVNEGEPLELKAKVTGSPRPTVNLKNLKNYILKIWYVL